MAKAQPRYAAPILASLVWGSLLLLGLGALPVIQAQEVPGFPTQTQVQIYFFFPVTGVALALGLFAASIRLKAGWIGAASLLLAVSGLLFAALYVGGA